MTDDEIDLLAASHGDHRRRVEVRVSGCLFACCGRGFLPREYEQVLHGYIKELHLPDGKDAGGARLVSRGSGTTYIAIFGFDSVIDVGAL